MAEAEIALTGPDEATKRDMVESRILEAARAQLAEEAELDKAQKVEFTLTIKIK